MKKFSFLFFLAFFATRIFSQTLFTYGNGSVDKNEFLRAYNKNKTPVTDKEKSLREYLELYIKFKLKVKAAQDLRMDTLQQLQFDLQNFREQVNESYMNDEGDVKALVDEAFTRSRKDIHVMHFFAPIDAKMSATDTVNAWQAMKELDEKLNAGASNYNELAQDLTKKYVKIKSADLGFITVFTVPYEYENIIYTLKPGTSSKPYRSRNGIHIFKVTGERPSAGTWKIAQILLAYPPGDQPEFVSAVQKKADSLYNALKMGADFSKMAATFSDDKLSYMTGGELPEFGTGKFDLTFENEAFKLTSDGEVGKPFAMEDGIHILKRLKQTPTPTDKNDASFSYELKQKVLQDSRISSAKEKFVKEILARIGFKRNTAVKDAELSRFADSVFADKSDDAASKNYPISNKAVFNIAKSNITGRAWLQFVHDYKNNPELYKGENNSELLNKFISTSALDYYKKHLEEYNPEFRYQMNEFRDGNILFEIMEKNVWGSAASDTAGLLKHYDDHKKNYLWASSASVILFNCNTRAAAIDAIAALKSGKDWKKIVADGNNNIQADSGRYETAQLPLPPGVKAEEGLISEPVVNKNDNTASFMKIINVFEAGLQRSFDEARGLVINDYQIILEEKWVNDLKKKYPVKVNEQVFQSLLK